MLVEVDFDSDWTATDYRVLADGYHFGTMSRPTPDGLEVVAFHDTRFSPGDRENFIRTYRMQAGQLELIDDRRVGPDWLDVHQMAYDGEHILTTSTGTNSVCRYSLDLQRVACRQLEGSVADINHVNSLFICGGHALVMLHNMSRRTSEVAVLDRTSAELEVVATLPLWHTCCHNLFVDADRLIYNASVEQALVAVDLQKDRIVDFVPIDCGHNKGLSATEDALIIGLSEEASRWKRGKTRGGLLVVDRETLKPIRQIDLQPPGRPTGNINEVRRLDAPDLAVGSADLPTIDWEPLRFAAGEPLRHFARQARLKALLPLRRLRKRLKK